MTGGAVKRLIDIVLASVLLVVLWPLLAAIWSAVRLDGGPALFRHQRIGRDGVGFDCLKFRTMRCDGDRILADKLASDSVARAEWCQRRKLRDDPRVTGLGALLRRSSLDELPQLLNVVKGEMSLVGPRPITEDELSLYGPVAGLYLRVRPGLTGLWQVSGRSAVGFEQRARLDSEYILGWRLSRDLAILARTVAVVLSRSVAI